METQSEYKMGPKIDGLHVAWQFKKNNLLRLSILMSCVKFENSPVTCHYSFEGHGGCH